MGVRVAFNRGQNQQTGTAMINHPFDTLTNPHSIRAYCQTCKCDVHSLTGSVNTSPMPNQHTSSDNARSAALPRATVLWKNLALVAQKTPYAATTARAKVVL
jgi:hypothetical protein